MMWNKLVVHCALLLWLLPSSIVGQDCGSVDYSFSAYVCDTSNKTMNNMKHTVGQCNNGTLELDNEAIEQCGELHPYCHSCGENKVVCSNSTDAATACQVDFPGVIPTEAGCEGINDGTVKGEQCTSGSGYSYEFIDCHFETEIKRLVQETTCGENVAGLTNCLDCKGISFCYGGEPGDLSCDQLNVAGLAGSMAPGLSNRMPAMLAAVSFAAMLVGVF